MKVKSFRFRVSNWTLNPSPKDKEDSHFVVAADEVKCCEEIDYVLNRFMQSVKVIDVKVSTIDVNYHNNGRGNKVDMMYTVLYEE